MLPAFVVAVVVAFDVVADVDDGITDLLSHSVACTYVCALPYLLLGF